MSDATPWWQEDRDPSRPLLGLLQELERYETARRADICSNLAFYGDRQARNAVSGGRIMALLDERGVFMSYNLCKSVSDAAQATIASQQTKPSVVTNRGNWSRQRAAKKMELALYGEYDRNDVWSQAHRGFLDAAKVGSTGFKVSSSNGRPVIELIRPGEVIVDPVEGQFGKPRSIYQIHYLDRRVAMGQFGSDAPARRAIESAPTADASRTFPWLARDTSLEQVKIIEAWRIPDPDDWHNPQPGRHVICTDGGTLLDEDWDRPLPFCFFHYSQDSTGFWGQGMVSNLKSNQRELNYVLMKIQDCIHLNASYRVLIERGSDFDIDQLANSPGEIGEFTGTPPIFMTNNSVAPELFAERDALIRLGFEQEGVSMLGASSRKPADLSSGKALQVYQDIESGRFAIAAKAFERFVGVDLAKLVVAEKKWIAEHDDEDPVRVTIKRRKGVKFERLKWSDVSLDDEDYSIEVFPSSALPRHPAGRMDTVQSWIAAGFISRDQGMQLLEFPDLDEFQAMEFAPYDIILDHVETMIEDGMFVAPESVQNLELSHQLVSNAYQRHTVDGAPEERTELMLMYLAHLEKMLEKVAPPPASDMAAAPAVPPAAVA